MGRPSMYSVGMTGLLMASVYVLGIVAAKEFGTS
jgi:hypothetical protein